MTSPSIPTKHEQGTKPLRTWTIVNDEWVEVYRQIVRSGSGYVETPVQNPNARSANK